MRTTASRSARVSKRQSIVSGSRCQPVGGPEPLDGVGVDLRVAAGGTSGRTSTGCRRCRPRTPSRRGAPPGRARAARARSRARRSRPSGRGRRPPRRPARAAPARSRRGPRRSRSRRVRRRASATSGGWGSTPTTRRAVSAKRGRWKPEPQPTSRTSRPDQSASDAHRGVDDAVGVGGPVLQLVGRRVVPDVGRRHDAVGRSRCPTRRSPRDGRLRCGRGRRGC